MTQPRPSQEAAPRTAPQQSDGAFPAEGPESRRPWRIVLIGVAALLVVAGIVLVVSLLGDDSDEDANRGPAEQTEQAESQDGGGEPEEPATPSEAGEEPPAVTELGEESIPGSLARAEAFMGAVVMGDLQSALGLGSAEFQARYAGDEAQLATELTEAAGGTLPDNYAIESIARDADAGTDVVTLRVTLPDGSYDELLLTVGEENATAVVIAFE